MNTSFIVNPALVSRRRLIVFWLWLTFLALAVVPMFKVLGANDWTILEVVTFLIFVLLMAQVSFGFTLAFVGYFVLSSGGDKQRLNESLPAEPEARALPPTAIIMPIYHEDVARVFQGVRVMYESLVKTGREKEFDFFILSDSNDPNYWVAEEMAWLELCRQVQGFGRIFYRNRRVPLNQKSGNVADFCRRWGASYRYMIVLDADSIMTGPLFVRLVQLMERNPNTGIIQTNPQSVLGRTLFQRVMQFAGRVYGPIYMAGASFWQLGSGNYWGHNAIIRVKPFMEHCAMPELPNTEALGRRILSHDTVEAALMRRAGYRVWFAYDLDGGYEEGPPDLLASLQRDRRWCRGNMQHLWFLLDRRPILPNRIHIWNGIMAFVSSPLWFTLLLLGTISAVMDGSQAATVGTGSFLKPGLGHFLFAYVMGLLLLPKALGVALALQSRARAKALGGAAKVLGSALAEVVFSFLLAPILMLMHSRFVVGSLTGTTVKWGTQKREAGEMPSWRECWSVHGGNTLFVLVWIGVIAWGAPRYLPWMAFVFGGLTLAIPFSRYTASKRAGQYARERGWFVIPEERTPPVELQNLATPFPVERNQYFRAKRYAADYGLLQALLDPYVNATHVSLLRQRETMNPKTREHLMRLGEHLLKGGPEALNASEKNAVLWDAELMRTLHHQLWRSSGEALHEWWVAAFRHYNESLAFAVRRAVITAQS